MTTAKKLTPKKLNSNKKPQKKTVVIPVSDTPKTPTTKEKKISKKVVVKKTPPVKKCGKCKKPKGDGANDCNCGRKWFDGKSEKLVLSNLEAAYKIGATDQQACLQADISPAALYRYEASNPEFRELKGLWKQKLVLKARSIINNVMNEEDKNGKPTDRALNTAWKYAEKKQPDEFGNNIGVITDDGKGVLTEERKAQIAGAMANWSEAEDGDERDEDYED